MKNPVNAKTVVVTGAASGIGRALAVELSRRGAQVACCDVNPDGLKETAGLCRGPVHTASVDVGDPERLHEYAAEVAYHFGSVHQVYNNAGISFTSPVAASAWRDYERVLRVNLNGVINGTLAFLPHLIASGDGHVVNISSLNGYLAQPGLSHYCTAKFGVRGFTESLRAEMLLERAPVKVSVVHPGGVATNIAASSVELARQTGCQITAAQEARQKTYDTKLLKLAPDKAAQIIVDGVEKQRARIRVGNDALAVDLLTRLMPQTAVRVAVLLERRLIKGEQSEPWATLRHSHASSSTH